VAIQLDPKVKSVRLLARNKLYQSDFESAETLNTGRARPILFLGGDGKG
jgi:hypothetical protein